MKKIALLLIMILSFRSISYAKEEELQLYAQSAVLMDADTGRILYSKDSSEAMANASTTKILTCILALEMAEYDDIAIASYEAQIQPAVHMGVYEGEEYYMEDLLYALMLESYNDSAIMIAEQISGSVDQFVELMNQKAKEIGCEDTYFVTPNGLDGEDAFGFHHTTASDLALIMKYCIMDSSKSQDFLQITQTSNYSFTSLDGSRSYSCYNHNTLLETMEDAISGKTGYTNDAGYCYVGAIESEGRTFIITLLACGWPSNRNYKWYDAEVLFDYGKNNYNYQIIDSLVYDTDLSESWLSNIPVLNGKCLGDELLTTLCLEESEPVTILMSDEDIIEFKIDSTECLSAPLEVGTLVGSVSYILDDETIKMDYLKIEEEIEATDWKWDIYKTFWNIFCNQD